jgi:hypothetical protein
VRRFKRSATKPDSTYNIFLLLAFTGLGVLLVVSVASGVDPSSSDMIALMALILTVPGAILAIRQWRKDPQPVPLELLKRTVRVRWEEAAEQRGLLFDNALRVPWRDTKLPVTGLPRRTLRPEATQTSDVTELGDHWSRLPEPRQLVIIGRPGSGKTSASILLAAQLLEESAGSGPIPVMISLSGWNPSKTSLREWIIEQLTRELPALKRQAVDSQSNAEWLLETGKLLPCFDGLDEAMNSVAALQAISSTIGKTGPFILTCRSAEYLSAIELRHQPLNSAAVIELDPITSDQVASYLPTGSQISGEQRWARVIKELKDQPDGALAQALSTPLMVYLAQVAYRSRPSADDLLELFEQAEIEARLLHAYLPALYPSGAAARSVEHPYSQAYNLKQAQRWLRFLARHLEDTRSQDIAWWRLHTSCGRLFATAFIVIGASIAGLLVALAAGPLFGMLFAIGIGLRVPGHTDPSTFSERLQVRSIALSTIGGVATGVVAGIESSALAGLLIGTTGGLAIGLSVKVSQRVGPYDLPFKPRQFYGANMFHSASLAVAIGLAIGVAAAFAQGAVPATVFGMLGFLVGGSAGWRQTSQLRHLITGGCTFGAVCVAASLHLYDLAESILLGTGVGLGVLMISAGTRFAISQTWNAALGRSPLALIRFLEDAASRGVLRRAGAGYKFRHLRIQQHLAS